MKNVLPFRISILRFIKTNKSVGNNAVRTTIVPDHGPNKCVTVFIDGACCGNGQEVAQAAIGVYWGPGNKLNTSLRITGRQTNNRAEILAAVHALRQAKDLGISNIRVCADSQLLINGITKWIDKWKENNWKTTTGKPVVNKEEFMELENACKGINVDWRYVKAHSENHGNNEADRLAVAGCDKDSETV